MDKAQYFLPWGTDRLRTRAKLLGYIEAGDVKLTRGPLAAMSFPDGFDPVAHPGENLADVLFELNHRGVTVS